MWLKKKQKGIILRYIEHVTGYSRQHISKLIKAYAQTGYIRVKSHRKRQGFQSKYSREDIAALAEVDQAMDGVSGTTVKALCQREFKVYGNTKFKGISGVSVSHLYNLRKSSTYQRCRRVFTKTQSTPVDIGKRCKPKPSGKPGYLRVDSVHQGDKDGKKGVYHINAVDKVNGVSQRGSLGVRSNPVGSGRNSSANYQSIYDSRTYIYFEAMPIQNIRVSFG